MRPKCWKTMASSLRRTARRASSSMAVTSRPLSQTWPAEGSISRLMQRIRVDLPQPESPMTTKSSPGAMSMEMSRSPTTAPVCSWMSSLELPDDCEVESASVVGEDFVEAADGECGGRVWRGVGVGCRG